MISKFFKTDHLYVRLYSNKIEVINLENGQSVIKNADEKFSSSRIVISNFQKADILLRSIIEELGMRRNFFLRRKIVIQQMEKMDGGLSDIEKGALQDLAEQAGAYFVIVLEHTDSLSIEQARLKLKFLM